MLNSKIIKSFLKVEKNRSRVKTAKSSDYEWIINESAIGYLPLLVDIPHEAILNEIANMEHLFVKHRQNENHVGWSSFCIHGVSYDATSEDNGSLTWTKEALELMPNTVEFFKNNWFGNEFMRLRVMKLDPGGYITLHRDNDPPGRLGAVNIAVTQPEGNSFVMENYGIVPFKTGSAIMLNISNRHAVINESSEVRYHIIAHHKKVTNAFKEKVIESYNKE